MKRSVHRISGRPRRGAGNCFWKLRRFRSWAHIGIKWRPLVLGCVVIASGPMNNDAATAAAETGSGGAERPPVVRFFEAGVDFTHFTNDYGNGNGQSMSYSRSREYEYLLRFDVGRAARFGDEGLGVGASFTKYMYRRWSAAAGLATGSGAAIFPRYRVDAWIGRAFLPDGNLQIAVGYVHEQSRGENKYDRYGCGLTWYAGAHWILGGFFNYDVGQPGNTVTQSGGAGASYGSWKRWYVGASVEFGDVSYTQIGPSKYLVDYEQVVVKGYLTEYFNPRAGVNLRLEWGRNDFYDLYGVSLSFFKEW